MNACQAALVVFVKTPGMSPIKTRLADVIGRVRAQEFYCLSLAAVEATVAEVAESKHICPYWSVAEEDGLAHPRWQRFARLHQGTDGLGERLSRVFAALQGRHGIVIGIGADSPQITPEIIRRAIDCLQQADERSAHVVGRCHDGGFYLVGTNHPLSPKTWQDVPFSTSAAAERLIANLAAQGTVHELMRLSDVDRFEDLAVMMDELKAIPNPSMAQQAVQSWSRLSQGILK
jgi:rSAM/selenodomain-associated transferase 1